MNTRRVNLKVIGRVQGVFYRTSTSEKAIALDIIGWVRNCADGSVEIDAQGTDLNISELIKWCGVGPQLSNVIRVEIKELILSTTFKQFEIRR